MNNTLNKKFLELLNKRNISIDVAEKFNIGIVHKNKIDGFFNFDLHSKFENRSGIIFPILDLYGNYVSTYLRSLDGIYPKYNATPFEKSNILFGLNVTWEDCFKKDECIIVEGPFDLFTLYSYGITNICASLGTSLSYFQVCLLRRFVSKCFIIYDGDTMGKYKSNTLVDYLKFFGINAVSVNLPKGFDPDEYINSVGKEKFLSLLS